MDEDWLSAQDAISKRHLREDRESIDELARDIEKLLDKASPGLPTEVRDTELRFHLTRALPDKIAFQLKLLPKQDYLQTISKARELLLIYQRAANPVNQIHISLRDDRLTKLEEAVQQMAQQVAALGARRSDAASSSGCFRCGRPGHLAKNCRYTAPHEIECFCCVKRGHIARQCQSPGNGKGGWGGGRPPPQLNAGISKNIPPIVNHTSTAKAAYTEGVINHQEALMLLDSGASCSVIHRDYVPPADLHPKRPMQLVNADGRGLASVGVTTMKVQLNNLAAIQTFVVVERV